MEDTAASSLAASPQSSELVTPMGDITGVASSIRPSSHSGDLPGTPLDDRLMFASTLSHETTAAAASIDTPMEDTEAMADNLSISNCNSQRRASGQQQQQQKHVVGKNNSSQDKHMKYVCPDMPEAACDIGEPEHVDKRVGCRMAIRPDRFKYVTLNFRVMRFDAEMHVGQIINMGGVKRSALYTPLILDRWTRTLQIKLKSSVKVSLVFKSISARLGLQSTVGIKYCLDGFYGVEAFGDAFGNYGTGICPWMEVTGDGTPVSLRLEDNDNIYINIATEKMLELARLRAEQISEQQFKQSKQRGQLKSRVSGQSFQSSQRGARASMRDLELEF